MKAKGDAFDVRTWAENAQRVKNTCCICVGKPEPAAAIKLIAEMRLKGETEVSQPQISQMLKERFGVRIGPSSIQRHVRSCLGIHWGSATRLK
jgi:hypothetical protein